MGTVGGFVVNSHQQEIDSFTPSELASRLGWNESSVALVQAQLKRIVRIVIAAFRQRKQFPHAKEGDWEIYGLDVALTHDLRAYLLDWNCIPGLGLEIATAQSKRQSASLLRDMYRIGLCGISRSSASELR